MEESIKQDFKTLWEQANQSPEHKEVAVKKIKVDFSICDLMDRYLELSKQAVSQGHIKKEVVDKLSAQTEAYKEAYSCIDHDVIQRLAKLYKKRLFDKD